MSGLPWFKFFPKDWFLDTRDLSQRAKGIYVDLFVDDQLNANWFVDSPLATNFFASVDDHSIGPLNAGMHTISVRVDVTAAVAESNETDNNYTRNFEVFERNASNDWWLYE